MKRSHKTRNRSRCVYFRAILLIAVTIFILSLCILTVSIEKLADGTRCSETGCYGIKKPQSRHERNRGSTISNVRSLPEMVTRKTTQAAGRLNPKTFYEKREDSKTVNKTKKNYATFRYLARKGFQLPKPAHDGDDIQRQNSERNLETSSITRNAKEKFLIFHSEKTNMSNRSDNIFKHATFYIKNESNTSFIRKDIDYTTMDASKPRETTLTISRKNHRINLPSPSRETQANHIRLGNGTSISGTTRTFGRRTETSQLVGPEFGTSRNVGREIRTTHSLGPEVGSTHNQRRIFPLSPSTVSLYRKNINTPVTPENPNNGFSKYAGVFTPVVANGTMYLYSAFFDSTESPPSVKVIAMVAATRPARFPVTCLLCFISGVGINVSGTVEMVPEAKYGYKYRSGIVTCSFRRKDQPITISITLDKLSTLSKALHVTYPTIEKVSSITRCYPVLHSKINDVTLLMQSVEASGVFGADHFVFYNQSVGPDVDFLLRYYVTHTDMVTVLEWRLPIETKDIHYWGQLLTLHDCLYRHLHTTRHILFADIDEILVPKQHLDWLTLMQHFSSRRREGCSAWIFQHAFFPTFQMDKHIGGDKVVERIWRTMISSKNRSTTSIHNKSKDFRSTIKSTKTVSLDLNSSSNATNQQSVSNIRSTSANKNITLQAADLPFLNHKLHSRIQSMHDRSKYIVNPKRVKMLGIHGVNAFKTLGYCYVNDKMALIHHYRQSWSNDMSPPWSHDDAIMTFSGSILSNVKNRLVKILDSTK